MGQPAGHSRHVLKTPAGFRPIARRFRAALLTGVSIALAGCIDVTGLHMPSGMDGSAGGGGGTTGQGGGAGTGGGGAAGQDGGAGAGGGAGAAAGAGGSAQSWTGYIEQYSFPSGSRALKLTVSADDQGVATGAIVLGQGVPPPPVTDPTVGYPPDFVAQVVKNGATTNLDYFYIAEGYAYPIDGTLEGLHLQFTADLEKLWSDWCVLQTPPGLNFGPCFALPSGTQYGATLSANLQTCSVTNYVEELPVDCGRLLLCTSATSVC
jgi:hypothetical protein